MLGTFTSLAFALIVNAGDLQLDNLGPLLVLIQSVRTTEQGRESCSINEVESTEGILLIKLAGSS